MPEYFLVKDREVLRTFVKQLFIETLELSWFLIFLCLFSRLLVDWIFNIDRPIVVTEFPYIRLSGWLSLRWLSLLRPRLLLKRLWGLLWLLSRIGRIAVVGDGRNSAHLFLL